LHRVRLVDLALTGPALATFAGHAAAGNLRVNLLGSFGGCGVCSLFLVSCSCSNSFFLNSDAAVHAVRLQPAAATVFATVGADKRCVLWDTRSTQPSSTLGPNEWMGASDDEGGDPPVEFVFLFIYFYFFFFFFLVRQFLTHGPPALSGIQASRSWQWVGLSFAHKKTPFHMQLVNLFFFVRVFFLFVFFFLFFLLACLLACLQATATARSPCMMCAPSRSRCPQLKATRAMLGRWTGASPVRRPCRCVARAYILFSPPSPQISSSLSRMTARLTCRITRPTPRCM
jgi:hypothetical protein